MRLADDGLDGEANGDELDGVAGKIRDKGRRVVAITAGVPKPDEVQSMARR